jgi:hypothetical protein
VSVWYMDSDSRGSSTSSVYFSRAKRAIVIVGFVTFLALEIYASFFRTSGSVSTVGAKINIGKFVCGEDVRVGDSLRVKICNKLISIFKRINGTAVAAGVEEFTLTESEWDELSDVIRR